MSSYETDQMSGIYTVDHNSGVYTEIQGTELERDCDRMQDEASSKNIWGDKKIRTPWSRTDGKRYPSKKEAAVGRRQNRNDTIREKEDDAAGLETICVIKHSGKVRG